ncbi:16S rRNA (adenine(1518)-N(6)/adenine(1519)-N(6))-dimethyltransferase RsmA [Gordonibacter massiliensis (ex Traore et al. 2017)]|uniref:16S rRNA (adenine(1518)-N(6)/adenine(1519)-N(6))- dimethyltransferase RsmA n=1 Tax=Gordonibacter massiliensis (ex Traore et al. 2017) TaxID=1841863 RepID=UPI001C8B15A9|nr:16S rRNA (adenine(1518)-N(6)/adenine(1519)-N(6))-dimethyltransferase RsmA [Gordonibacter massiliensis (ex Traore et al. 2017)]
MAKLSPLASVSETRAVLEAHGLTTKYSLGQNFLVNDAILQKIVALAEVGPDDAVLEVGPGIGTLTIALLQHAARVVSVERDPDLPAVLAETCAPWADRFALVEKDALHLAADDLAVLGGFLPDKLVANLPYAVAATVVLDYFERFASLESATVMVQKEVADRMSAVPGTKSYGAYTVKLRLYAEPAGRFGVGPGNFFPPPRVESAVLRLNRRTLHGEDGAPLDAATLKAAATMADAAFANRRKTLSNSCKTYFAGRGAEGAHVAAVLPQLFEQAEVDPKLRGEALALEDFIRMGQALSDMQRRVS